MFDVAVNNFEGKFIVDNTSDPFSNVSVDLYMTVRILSFQKLLFDKVKLSQVKVGDRVFEATNNLT